MRANRDPDRAGRAGSTPERRPDSPASELQQTLGNRARLGLLRAHGIHPKLEVAPPHDPLEHEADRAAEAVLRMKTPPCSCGGTCAACRGHGHAARRGSGRDVLRRKAAPCACGGTCGGTCAECRKRKQGVLRRPAAPPLSPRSAAVEAQAPAPAATTGASLLGGLGSGRPLDSPLRGFFEPRFGRDFGRVRIHTGVAAAASARTVGAAAFTLGRDIVFGQGRYAPGTGAGRGLLAHELAHTVQQGADGPPTVGAGATTPADRAGASRPAARSTVLQRSVVNGEPRPGVAAPGRLNAAVDAAIVPVPVLHRIASPFRQLLQRQPVQPAACTPREPGNCPTYEQWLHAFLTLIPGETFTAADGVPGGTVMRFNVLGGGAASRDPNAPAADQPPAPVGPRAGDRFIDHPTDQWVRQHLPENLRRTAYQLPADCADIVVILRHVWLSAHHRTERYNGWLVGDAAGRAAQTRIGGVIGSAYTGNLHVMVNAYSDANGRPIRSFARLQELLHPGDILVWAHHDDGLNRPRTGGHSHTVVHVVRDGSGRITSLTLLQGNQPLFETQAEEIREHLRSQGARRRPSEEALRNAPGRRIEVSTLVGEELGDVELPRPRGSTRPAERVWSWNDPGHTILVAAGPPRAAPRPPAGRRGRQRIGQITDWLRSLRGATRTTLQGVFEAAMQEARATIEGGQPVTNADAGSLGETAGERLWSLAKRSVDLFTRRGGERGDRGERSHFDLLHRIRAAILALGGIRPPLTSGNPHATEVRQTFRVIDDSFTFAARGATDIAFGRRIPRRSTLIRVLLTGFDPFTAIATPPAAGTWNPSGAAVLALDDEGRISLGHRAYASIEGVVLPVSFTAFRAGIVERILRQHAPDADAVITVSEAPIDPSRPVRIEQFAVGVHGLRPLMVHRLFPTEQRGVRRLEAVPNAPPGTFGPAIFESTADVAGIAREAQQPARRGRPAVPQPTIGTDVTFRFADATQARDALAALGTTGTITRARGSAVDVTIADAAAIGRIIATAHRLTTTTGAGTVPTTGITFDAGGRRFTAHVIEGPGGDFLSNEVSFRVLRELARRSTNPVSFHVHTQEANLIPQDRSTRAARRTRGQALGAARTLLRTLIATLRSIVRAMAGRIAAQRRAGGSGTP